MYGKTERRNDRQKKRQTEENTDRRKYRHKKRQTEGKANKDGQKDINKDRLRSGHKGRQYL